MSAAHLHVLRHRRGRDEEEAARDQAQASLLRREVQWRMLLEALGRWGRTEEVSPGRLRVHLEHPDAGTGERRVLTIVVTPGQWEHVLVTRAGGDPELYLDELLGPRDEDEHVVVFYDGDLVRSTREQLPPVRGRALERQLAEHRVDPDATPGWFASRPEGS